MARTKQRENYGNGSITPVMVPKVGKDGLQVVGSDGKPAKVQKRNKSGQPAWRICVVLGSEEYTDNKGRRRKRPRKAPQKVFYGTLEEARAFCKEYAAHFEHIDTSAACMTFADAVAAWADSMRDNETCAPSKLKDYTTRLGYVADKLGTRPLIEITTDELEKALAAVKVERNQSQRTYRDCKRHVKRVYKFALRKHWIVFDASADLETVSVRTHTVRRSLEADQFARLRACIDRDLQAAVEDFEQKETRQADWGNMFTRSNIKGLANISCMVAVRLLLSTGMRRGEALALMWGKVDFGTNSILIDKSLNADAVLKEPKTEAGTRRISVDADTMAMLERWRDFQARVLHLVMVEDESGKRQPVGQDASTPVVCSCVGGFLNPHNINRWWNVYRARVGFDGLKLHELRHTQATLLLGSGVPVLDVAARLGHDDVSVTLNTYGHAIPANDRAAADLLGALMAAPATPSANVIRFEKKDGINPVFRKHFPEHFPSMFG